MASAGSLPAAGKETGNVVSLPETIPYFLADRIKAGIIRWRYPPGSSLREADLAAEYGASRGPVREALRILELQGLVVHAPRRGFKVKHYTADDLRHLYRLRVQLEAEVIDALSTKAVDGLCDALDRINGVMRDFAARRDLEGYFSNNIEFHQLMIDSTESSVLRTILHQVNAMSLPVRFILLSDEFSGRADYKYHRDITQAIRTRNFKLARRMTVEHITANLQRVIDVYAEALDRHRER
ncbi:MAG: GntR family transcriptional regulator [Rhodospirillales bacterium]|nr:GntR family transcriptional regulator [Rhodospirillales bacterium]